MSQPGEAGSPPAAAALVAALKAGERRADIRVLSAAGEVLGSVEPITHALAADRALHAALSRWRAENMAGFLTVFHSTPEKTADFLTGVSLPAASRLLCLIRDAAGTPVGNIGLCNIAAGAAELDNVLRGARGGAPGFMRRATRAFLDWSFVALELGEIYLHVLEDNARAVGLYEAVGFQRGKRLSLWRRDTAEGYDLLRTAAPGGVPVATRLLRMTLLPGPPVTR